MSKFFFKGRIDVMGKYGTNSFKPDAKKKLGTKENPLILSVQTEARLTELQLIIDENQWQANIDVNPECDEDIKALTTLLNKPKTQRFEKTPERNDPCSCGSGKKYKKCCG